MNKDDYTTVVDYPVEFAYDPEQYMPIGDLPSGLQIEINGNGWDLLRKYFNINESPFIIELENPARQNQIQTSELKRSLTDFLSPTQLLSILDDSLSFQIDRIQSARLRPYLDSTSFSLATNYRLISKISFDPDQITLRGPSSVLENFEGEFPVFLDENRIDQNIEKKVKLEIPKQYRDQLSLQDEVVTVSFNVVNFLEGNQRLNLVKRNFPNKASLANEDEPILFYYLVDSREVEKFSEIEFEAILDFSQRNREDSTILVRVSPKPEYLEILRIVPEKIKIVYE
ncbi:YbbR-like domain-containing protein [Algoriphagus namhaensis]|uniref:YbbR-like domain-containing protein n=1 Tax=Algoriphagus namhaensis TaxID=915353 RepID=A0ABV8APS2_9BACT